MNWWVLAFVVSLLAVPEIVEIGWETNHSFLGYAASALLVGFTALIAHLRDE